MMFRLWLDVPYKFAIKPAWERALHMVDARYDSQTNLYHDPVSGVMILRPSTFSATWQQHIMPLSQINYQSEHWREARRGLHTSGGGRPSLLARIRKPNPSTYIELLVQAAIVAVEAGLDVMKWVIETIPSLARDEGFAVHLQCADDEYSRDGDYLYVQWDRYGLHLDTRGVLSLYRYNRNDLTQPPNKITDWHSGVASPVRSALSIAVIPLPPLGLLVLTLTSGASPPVSLSSSSTTRQLVSSKLVPLYQDAENIGTESDPLYSLCRPSQLRIGCNIRYNPIVGIERIRYPTAGVAIEKPFALPDIAPQVPTVAPIIAYTHVQSATASPLLADGSNWATAQSPSQARVKLTLTTNDPRYTPIVVGYYMRAEPYYATRDTTPVLANRLRQLELTFDEFARDEGSVELFVDSAALRAIVERGDTTYKLEYTPDGTNWIPISGGFAMVDRLELAKLPTRTTLAYHAQLSLRGMWSRFSEIYMLSETAFDGVRLGDAFNKLLEGCGFEPINSADLPAALQAIRMPVAQQGDVSSGWRYAPRVGQSGDEILKTLLLFATASGQEWRLRYDLTGAGRWILEQKPDGLPHWHLYPSASSDPPNRIARYSGLQITPQPPEANLIYVEGATAPSKEGERNVVIIVNEDSLDNPASADYLGRIKILRLHAEGIDTEAELQNIANRLYDAACRACKVYEATVLLPREFAASYLDLWRNLPRKVILYNYAGSPLAEGYIKRATLMAQSKQREEIKLQLSIETRYMSDPRGY